MADENNTQPPATPAGGANEGQQGAPKPEDKGANPNPTGKGADEDKGGEAKFTQAQMDDAIKARLERSEKAFQETLKAETQKAVEDAVKKSQLSEKEREQAELKEREQKVAEDAARNQLTANGFEAIKSLVAKNIPNAENLVELVKDIDIEKQNAKIDSLVDAFNKSVESGIKTRLEGKAPTAVTQPNTQTPSELKTQF